MAEPKEDEIAELKKRLMDPNLSGERFDELMRRLVALIQR